MGSKPSLGWDSNGPTQFRYTQAVRKITGTIFWIVGATSTISATHSRVRASLARMTSSTNLRLAGNTAPVA
jgi:hypothetical protein